WMSSTLAAGSGIRLLRRRGSTVELDDRPVHLDVAPALDLDPAGSPRDLRTAGLEHHLAREDVELARAKLRHAAGAHPEAFAFDEVVYAILTHSIGGHDDVTATIDEYVVGIGRERSRHGDQAVAGDS